MWSERVGLDVIFSRAGARLAKHCRTRGGTLVVLEVRLRWLHEYGDVTRDVTAAFVGTSRTLSAVSVAASENMGLDFSYNAEYSGTQDTEAFVARADYMF